MNREDPGKYWGHQPHYHSKGSKKGTYNTFQGKHKRTSWINHQSVVHSSRFYSPRSSKSKSRKPYHKHQHPEPPKPPSPLPGSEAYTRRKIEQTSQILKKQMAECPDNDIVLPAAPTISETNQNSDHNNESSGVQDAIGFLQAAVDSTAAELNNIKKNSKKTPNKFSEQNLSVDEICDAILDRISTMEYKKKYDMVHQQSEVYDIATRQLQRQYRLKASKELRNMRNKGGSSNNFTTLNAIIPDYVVKLQAMPEKFLAKISSKIDLETEDDYIYLSQESPFDQFGNDTDTNSQSQFENHHSDNNSCENNFDTREKSKVLHEFNRRIICESLDSEIPEMKTEPICIDSSADESQNSIYQENHSSPCETPPAPNIRDICTLLGDPADCKSEKEQVTRNISVICDFQKTECEESQESQDTSGTPDDDNRDDKPDASSNGFNHVLDEDDMNEDIKFRKNFDLKIDDNWNRNIVIKTEPIDSELNQVTTKCDDSLEPTEDVNKDQFFPYLKLQFVPTKVQNESTSIEENKTSEDRENPEKVGSDTPVISNENNENKESETQDLPTSEQSDESTKAKKLQIKPDCTSIILLEATNNPWTFKLKKSKLPNEHMYCKNLATVKKDNVEQQQQPQPEKSNEIISEGIQTEISELRPKTNPKRIRRNWKHLRAKTEKRKPRIRKIRNKNQGKSTLTLDINELTIDRSKSKAKSLTTPTKFEQMKPPRRRLSTNDKRHKDSEKQTDLSGSPNTSSLQQKYSTKKRQMRELLNRLNAIDQQILDLFNEKREILKSYEALESSDESDEEPPKKNKKQVPKYIIFSEGGSTPSKVNPVLNSVPPSEQMLTQIGDNEPTPDALPDFLMHSLDLDIFSMMPQPQQKSFSGTEEASDNAGMGEMDFEDEQYSSVTGEGSATGIGSIDMAESSPFPDENTDTTGTPEMEISNELKTLDVISNTMPADILEPSDNEGMGDTPSKLQNPVVKLVNYNLEELERMKQGIVNNNVKIEADISSMDGLDSDVISEFVGSEVQVDTEPVDTTMDFVEWDDAILVVKIFENVIIAGNNKGKLFYYDVESPYPLHTEFLSTKAITSICIWKKDTRVRLFIGSHDPHLYIYDFVAKALIKSINVPAPIQCLEMGWTGLYLGSTKGQLIGYCVNTSRLSTPVSISHEAVLAIKALQEGPRKILLVATRNSPLTVHDASTGLLLRIIGGQLNPTVYSLIFHNNRIYCGTSHDDVLAFSFQDGSLMFKHPEPGGSGVICMSMLRHLLFVACYNGNIYVYDTENNSFITSMSAPRGLFLCMAVTDTKLIAGTKQSFQCMPLPASVLGLL